MDWYVRYPALYRLDTGHLSLAEHGAYNLLIDWYMENRRPPPDNDRALAKIVGVGLDEWQSVGENVRTFFKSRGGMLHHKRCDHELDEQDRRSKIRSELGKKGAEARHNKLNGSHSPGMPRAQPEHAGGITMPVAEPELRGATGQDKTGQERDAHRGDARLDPDIVAEFETTFWPNCWVKSGKKPALKAFVKARKRAPLEVIMAGVFRYKKILDGPDPPKPKWPQGWLNDDRWTDQALELREPPTARHGQAGL